MKRNIIIVILMLFVVGAAQGQELQVDAETQKSGYVILLDKKDGKETNRWPIQNDTVTIKSDNDIFLSGLKSLKMATIALSKKNQIM